ncbi:LysR family transcriptional regulator [Mangrovicoccus algicola]|uniref:LysR family transcriptional regulator n=1 Tax=Mangrovicoccus algicola TaxID=2771008 RepID=A0A8J7CZ22_9RHOB|nr:LysR family transcriptional regulator [Mangrovicoccus algicola]MBE3640302.1 LysR family transcriptional regulator [Mangrovicoccus algicola]
MLNAQWLETFVTLCDEGHFTRAAARLNMTQPGVSQHLRKLEAQLGQPLLSRDGKSFVLTPAGTALREIGTRRREEERGLRRSLQQDDPGAGAVALACSGSLALIVYPRMIARMVEAPALALHVEACPQPRILEAVAEGKADLGIADHAPAHPRLEGERIGRDALCLVLPAGAPAPATLADLDRLGFIAHPDGFAYADALLGANFARDYAGADRLRQRSFVNQIGQIPEPVAQGLGYTILPRSGVEGFAGRDRLSVATLPRPVQRELWLIRRRNRVVPARVARIAQDLRALFAERLRDGAAIG